ncbi:MAG: DUF4129 domain-containing protein [Chloroflexota bacterium]
MVNVGTTAVQYLLLLVGEVSWAYPWSLMVGLWLVRIDDAALELPVLAGMLVLALAATRLAAITRLPTALKKLLLTLLALASVSLVALLELPAFTAGLGPEVLWGQLFNSDSGGKAATAAAFAAFLWWRAAGLGRLPMRGEVVEEGFRAGVVAMICLLIFVAAAGDYSPLPADVLLLCALVMVSTGLVGMPLAMVVDVGRSPRHRGGAAPSPAGPWLAMLLTVVGALLVAALLLAQLFTFDRVAAAWAAISGPLGDFLWMVVYLLAIPIGLLVQLLVFLISLVPRSGAERPRQQADSLQWLDQLKEGEPVGLGPEVVLALKVALAVALALLLAWIVLRALSRLRNGWGQEDADVSHDFVWSWPGIGDLWGWLLARWRPIRARGLAGLTGGRGGGVTGLGVRRLYREFLTLGVTLGRARRASETPLEYERRLLCDSSLPGSEEVNLITEGYNRERYARPPSRPSDLQPLASALDRLRRLWRGQTS